MSDLHLALKLLHVLGASVLFGTGAGIAFFMWMADRTRDAEAVWQTARIVVVADFVFTATAVILQPLTGAALVHLVGYSWSEPWVVTALALYVLTGLCWLPVVVIQMRMRDFAADAVRHGTALQPAYHRLFRAWFILGWPAFIAVLLIFADMIWKPALW
jgi:uncharacterized membrane protein